MLLEPVDLGGRRAPNRVVFGPHVTNLGDGRSLSDRHVAYYRRRAEGGCGTIVVEGASVHPIDHPYERAPLADHCGDGLAAIVAACRPHGSIVVASLDHAGGQGSSAYSQRELWAPSRVPEVASREVPKWMEPDDIAAVVAGFAAAAKLAADAGCDGVEVNAGQHSLVRQFLSGLTNHRGDEWGGDRLRFARDVLTAARDGLGGVDSGRVLALRLSCDELAPWAGITPEAGALIAAELAPLVDVITVVRGSIFTVQATRPDHHEPAGFNRDLCAQVRSAVRAAGHATPVVLQGSVVDVAMAETALADGAADLVEMTRAQIADPDLVAKVGAGHHDRVRPCIRCNQTCQVRDARNPIVTCVGEPASGHETVDPPVSGRAPRPRSVLVVGGGIAGLECARVAAARGHTVHLVERRDRLGGVAAISGPGSPLAEWLAAECTRLGVRIETGVTALDPMAEVVVICTGSRRGVATYEIDAAASALVVDVLDVREGIVTLPDDGPILVWDPIGGPIAVALAEDLGARAVLITPDQIAGNELARTGDLAPANTRLQQRGVTIERRAVLGAVTSVGPAATDPAAAAGSGASAGVVAHLVDRFTGAERSVAGAVLVDCGFRLPDEVLWDATGRVHARAGDAVAPRTYLEAVLEGRRVALALDGRA